MPFKLTDLFSGVILVSLLAVLAGAPGCATQRDVRFHGKTPEQIGVIGAQVYGSPDSTDEILEENGLTRAEFEQAVREITAQTDLARRYRKAFEAELNRSDESSGSSGS